MMLRCLQLNQRKVMHLCSLAFIQMHRPTQTACMEAARSSKGRNGQLQNGFMSDHSILRREAHPMENVLMRMCTAHSGLLLESVRKIRSTWWVPLNMLVIVEKVAMHVHPDQWPPITSKRSLFSSSFIGAMIYWLLYRNIFDNGVYRKQMVPLFRCCLCANISR